MLQTKKSGMEPSLSPLAQNFAVKLGARGLWGGPQQQRRRASHLSWALSILSTKDSTWHQPQGCEQNNCPCRRHRDPRMAFRSEGQLREARSGDYGKA